MMSVFAQTDTIPPVDSTLIVVDSLLEKTSKKEKKEKNGLLKKLRDKKYPNPTRAAVFSLALPGYGQFYNKKYWKIPIVYAGLGGLTWLAIDQQKQYNTYKEYYKNKVDGDPNTIDVLPNANAEAVRRVRNQYDKRRQQAYIGIAAFWILSAVDAYVDAHLMSFDVSEDLTMHIQPTFQYQHLANTTSIGIQFSFQPTVSDAPKALLD